MVTTHQLTQQFNIAVTQLTGTPSVEKEGDKKRKM